MVVQLTNVAKTYGGDGHGVRALVDVSFEVRPGEFVAIMGPSGSGKSTLLNLLGLLDTPSEGTYRLTGVDVSTLDDDALSRLRNRQIGFIFQSFNLFPHLNVMDNVEVPMVYAGWDRLDREARALDMLTQVGLGHRLRHRPTQLSGGEMQRVAIARALSLDPSLILADEPTGNLDTTNGDEISRLLRDLNARGRTIIMVTHNPALAEMCDRTVHIQDGRIRP